MRPASQQRVTSFYNCTEAPHALPGVLASQAEVVQHWGMRGILSFEATERVDSDNGQLGLRENADFARSCKENDLLGGMICHHTTFTCSADFIRQAYQLAEEMMSCSTPTFQKAPMSRPMR